MAIERAPLKIGFCGEVSSGKSTALQSILRRRLIPDFFGQDHRPIFRVMIGAETETMGVLSSDGDYTAISDLAEIDDQLDIAEVQIALTGTFELGRPCELVEVPPLRHGYVRTEQIDEIADCALLVWTTIGSQAWRLSEKTIIDEFGARFPEKRVLIATRADKFRNEKDREKLRGRLERETSSYFWKGHLLGVPPKLFAAADDDDLWAAAGATDFVTTLMQALKDFPDNSAQAATFKPTIDAVAVPRTQASAQSKTEDTPEPTPSDDSVDDSAKNTPDLVADDIASGGAEDHEDEDAKTSSNSISNDTLAKQSQPDESIELQKETVETLLSSAPGLVAVGKVNVSEPDRIDSIFGTEDIVAAFANFCAVSAIKMTKLTSVAGVNAEIETELTVTSEHCITVQVKDDQALFLVGDKSVMTAGSSRQLFSRLRDLLAD